MDEIYMLTEDSWFPYKQHTVNANCPKIITNVGLRLWCNALALWEQDIWLESK